MLIDKYIDKFHYHEKHELVIPASVKECFLAAKHLDISPSFITRLLLRLRGLPYKQTTLQDFIKRMCFTWLEENPNSEFIIDASKNHIKIYWNLYFEEISPFQTRVSTETRIYCPDNKAKKRFSLYWFFIKPFSGYTRKELLRMILKKAAAHDLADV